MSPQFGGRPGGGHGGGGGGRFGRPFRPGRRPPPGPPDDPKTALSKVLSYALRHKPEEFGLNPDQFGRVPLNELIVALQERPRWASLTEEQIVEIVEGSEKQRFEIGDGLIRARYGHSYDVTPPGEPSEPPELLYHGTPRNAIPVIMEDGLKSMRRRFVHLSASMEDARQVGVRRDPEPVILEIQARRAHGEGVRFFMATEKIFLCECVPSAYLKQL